MLAGGTTPYAYAWSSGITSTTSTATIIPLVSQSYTVTLPMPMDVRPAAQIAINLGPALFASIDGVASVCSGLSTNLCATATGGTGGNIYSWQPGNLATPCVTVSPLHLPPYLPYL